ncbi:MFS transporter [Streptomyces anandii]|uniref:MFS transporter n=1 Tax=Streptomyces anandii TaxID=285454 RepID=UPI0037B23C80
MRAPTPVQALVRRGLRALGGPARAGVALPLAATLALDGADKGTVSAMASQLKQTFGIDNTQVGLLVSVVALSSAVPESAHHVWLLCARAALGAVSATAGPTVASLMGDSFPIKDRARMFGLVLAGELLGTGLGFAVSGFIGSFLTWRFAFLWLVIPAGVLVWRLSRLPEPERGGQSRSEPGQEDLEEEPGGTGAGTREARRRPGPDSPEGQDENIAGAAARRARVEPHEQLVLDSDPRTASKWWSIHYVLRVRTNLVLIAASALGYFYFAGLRSFATLYTTHHYGIPTSVATSLVLVVGVGALAGVLSGGRIADRLLRGGRVNARALVPTVCMLAVPFALAPAIYVDSLGVALPLLVTGTLLLGAANPPLDAARLDILPPFMWGTGEGVRTMLRTLCEAVAPTLFGYFSTSVFAGHGGDNGTGLEYTLLFFLIALVGAGLLGLVAMRSYPRDLATAEESARRIRESSRTQPARHS